MTREFYWDRKYYCFDLLNERNDTKFIESKQLTAASIYDLTGNNYAKKTNW